MTRYFVKRFLLIFPTIIGISFIAFIITQLVPGGPLEQIKYSLVGGVSNVNSPVSSVNSMQNSEALSEEDLASLKELYGFDKPWYTRYFIWLYKLSKFDFGTSFRYMVPVTELIKERLPISLYYGLITAFLIYAICIPLGVVKALKNSKLFDTISSWLIFAGYAIPPFALGIVLLVVFASHFAWFPLGGFISDEFDLMSTGAKVIDVIWHSVLPLIAYLLGSFATMTMVVKNSVLENISQDFVKFALAKGVSRKRAIFYHALRNSLIPIATTIGDNLGVFLMGSFIIETIFNIDGIGLLGYTAITERDYPVVLGILVISSFLKLLGNIVSDMSVAIVDPRVRFK